MIIVDTDNLGGDYPAEKVIASGIKEERHALVMAEALNLRFSGSEAPRFYKVEADDYQLLPGFEP